MKLLEISQLNIYFKTREGSIRALSNISFTLNLGETLGIVGESGSGKSQTALAIIGLTAKNSIINGSIKWRGQELLKLQEKQLNKIRSSQIAIIFQDPMTALNPYITIGKQLTEVLILHKKMSYKQAFDQSVAMLQQVKISEAKKRMHSYAHELSGGMKQRIMIAMALLCEPQLIIADEPTTALDVTVQAQILKMLYELKKKQTSIILITHNLGIVANICDQILIMYGGQIMEYGTAHNIFKQPSHPYTQGLLSSIPQPNNHQKLSTIAGIPPNLLELQNNCPFHDRCTSVMQKCQTAKPSLKKLSAKHQVSCFLYS